MRKIVTVCANPDCEKPIQDGDRAWRKGKDLYCHSKCLKSSFGVAESWSVLREKHLSIGR